MSALLLMKGLRQVTGGGKLNVPTAAIIRYHHIYNLRGCLQGEGDGRYLSYPLDSLVTAVI